MSSWLETTAAIVIGISPKRWRCSRSLRQWPCLETAITTLSGAAASWKCQSMPKRSAIGANARSKSASAAIRPGLEHDALEEPAGIGIAELGGGEDVGAVLGQQPRDGGDDAGPVGAGDGQDPDLRGGGKWVHRRGVARRPRRTVGA